MLPRHCGAASSLRSSPCVTARRAIAGAAERTLRHGPRHRGQAARWCAPQQGAGRAAARRRSRDAGCDVTILARTAADVERAAQEIGAARGTATWPGSPATSPRPKAAQQALAACPQPDILVNNAGGPPPATSATGPRGLDPRARRQHADADRADQGDDRRHDRAALRAHRQHHVGSAVKAPIDILGLSNGARSGLTGFVAGLARKVAVHNVTINNLLPGPFDTDRLAATSRCARRRRRHERRRAARAAAGGASRRAASAHPTSSARLRVPLQRAGGLHRRPEPPASTAASTRARSEPPTSRPHDRPLLLDHAERPQDHDLPRGDRAAVSAEARATSARASSSIPSSSPISPNNRIPAIVDHVPPDGGAPLSLMESGAILLYLARQDRPLLSERPARPLRGRRSGCSGRWRGWGRWRGRRITSCTTRRSRSPTRSTATCARRAACTAC